MQFIAALSEEVRANVDDPNSPPTAMYVTPTPTEPADDLEPLGTEMTERVVSPGGERMEID